MKKIILFVIITLSINVFAQNKKSVFDKQYQKAHSLKNAQVMMANSERKTDDSFPNKYLDQKFKHKTHEENLVIQINDSIYQWQWDTIVNNWLLASKYIDIVYDANNNLTSSVKQLWNDNSWENYDQRIYSFDVNNNLISDLYQIWNADTWENSWLDSCFYDSYNNLTSELVQRWDGFLWEYNSQYIYTYDTCNNLTSVIVQFGSGGIFENYYKYSYYYGANYNLARKLDQNWNGTAWVNKYQYIYTYDTCNILTNELNQKWNSGNWVNQVQYTYTYDTNFNLISLLDQYWSGINWENSTKYNYTYDPNNNRTHDLRQSWYYDIWMDYYQSDYTYDINNNLISSIGHNLIDTNWVVSYRSNYTYDVNNFKLSESSKYWNNFDNTLYSSDSAFYYFHTANGINDIKVSEKNISVYPNPNNGTFTVRSKSIISAIEIYNSLGILVYSDFNINWGTLIKIDLSFYDKGIHFMKIYNGEKTYTEKIIIQ